MAITNSAQTVVNKYSYDPFGNIPSDKQQENILNNDTRLLNQPFKYVGQYGVMTEPNGLYYMKARYYDPTVGRFISEDPIGFNGGDTNLMAYVGNNPVTGIDPEGLCASTAIDFLSNGRVQPVYLIAGGIGAIIYGLTAPASVPITLVGGAVAAGIMAIHEGILLGVINYGLGGDTSNVPLNPLQLRTIAGSAIRNR